MTEPASSSIRALIVDDNRLDAVLIARALAGAGITAVTERVDTPEGLEARLAEDRWDVVLSDHTMPELDSLGVVAAAKNSPFDPPVIVVSGQIGEDTLAHVLRSGARDYVSKNQLGLLPLVVQRVVDERRAASQLTEAHWQARRQERSLDLETFVNGVAHEINNPLTYMQFALELLAENLQGMQTGPAIDEATRSAILDSLEACRSAQRGVSRIEYIVRALHKITSAGARPRVDADVNELVTRSLPPIPAHVHLETHLDAHGKVRVDEADFRDALQAIVQNGCEAMSEGSLGVLAIRTRDVGANKVRVEVEDHGGGIPPELQNDIFTPFFTTKSGGTGLSLSIARRLVEEQDGILSFTTSAGQGSTFRIELPTETALAQQR